MPNELNICIWLPLFAYAHAKSPFFSLSQNNLFLSHIFLDFLITKSYWKCFSTDFRVFRPILDSPFLLQQRKTNHFSFNSISILSTIVNLYSHLLVTSSPLQCGHGCRMIKFACVGGQHKNPSQVQLQYKPEINQE